MSAVPAAVYRLRGDGTASICAHCDAKAAADAWAIAHGLKPSHGICPACVPKLLSEVVYEGGERVRPPFVCLGGGR